MGFFIYILLVIILFRPLNKFILGNNDLLDDLWAFFRWFLIIFFIFIVYQIGASIYSSLSTGRSFTETIAILSVTFIILLMLILWMRHLYNNAYSEDETSFTYNGIFRKGTVPFAEIDRVKYYHAHRGGSGYRIQDLDGKKYNLPNGFFNMLRLEEYIRNSTLDNIRDHTNRWVDLIPSHQRIQKVTISEPNELKIKLFSRLKSMRHDLLPPRKEREGSGQVQRPSKVYYVLVAALTILFLLSLVIFINEMYLLITGRRSLELDLVLLAVFCYVLGHLTFWLFGSIRETYYYEDAQRFEFKSSPTTCNEQFHDIDYVIVKHRKVNVHTKYDDRPSTRVVKTTFILPEGLIDYLSMYFEVSSSEPNRSLYLRRKSLTPRDYDSDVIID